MNFQTRTMSTTTTAKANRPTKRAMNFVVLKMATLVRTGHPMLAVSEVKTNRPKMMDLIHLYSRVVKKDYKVVPFTKKLGLDIKPATVNPH